MANLLWIEKADARGYIPKSWKNFRLNLDKFSKDTIDAFIQLTHEEINKWERSLKEAVSILIPKQYLHRARPANRLFPYQNSGKQKRNIRGKLKTKITGQGNVSITASGEIGVDYAYFTNYGKPARKDGATPKWEKWVNDVLTKRGGRGSVLSIADVFDELASLRKII